MIGKLGVTIKHVIQNIKTAQYILGKVGVLITAP